MNAPFKPGKLMEIRGAPKPDVVMIASGAGVAEAFEAAKKLEGSKVAASVWNAHSLKPFDSETTKKIVNGARLVVTVEDRSGDRRPGRLRGGGACRAHSASQAHEARMPGPVRRIRRTRRAYKKHGFSANQIHKRVLGALGSA